MSQSSVIMIVIGVAILFLCLTRPFAPWRFRLMPLMGSLHARNVLKYRREYLDSLKQPGVTNTQPLPDLDQAEVMSKALRCQMERIREREAGVKEPEPLPDLDQSELMVQAIRQRRAERESRPLPDLDQAEVKSASHAPNVDERS